MIWNLALAALLSFAPPTTTAKPTTDTYFSEQVVDPYRWLESLEKDSPEVKAWTDAQLANTRSVLDALPCRGALSKEFEKLMTIDAFSAPRMRENRYFYSERTGTMNQGIVRMRMGFDGAPTTILDPNTMDSKGLVALDWWDPNWQGTMVAYGSSFAGSENSTLKILDVDSKKMLPDQIEGKVDFGGWSADGKAFVYSRLTDPKNPYSRVVFWHVLGTAVDKDIELLKQTSDSRVPGAGISRDGKWLVFSVNEGWGQNDVSVAPVAALGSPGALAMTDVAKGLPATFAPVDVINGTLYMVSTLGTPKGSLVAVDLKNPAQANWRTVVPEAPDMVLNGVQVAKGMFVINWEKDASTRITRHSMDGKAMGDVQLPGLGTAGISVEDTRTEAFVSFASYNSPRTVYRLDLAQPKPAFTVWARPSVPAKLDDLQVTQIRATSKDGASVPAFVVMKKGTAMNGQNPTVLYGYGGFNVSLTPEFIPSIVPFLERGGIYVVANLRGGQEYGEDWHKAGMLGNKQNVFNDLYAVAEKLIAEKYTSTPHLAVMGGSNGGLLTGVAVTQRPDLWSCAISAVPLLDMLRYHKFLLAKYWVPEYGSSEDQTQYAWLKAYSPYQNVKPGTKYPAVLFTAGENDSRVHPLHARKMAALMQASTASDPAAKPILLYVDREAGHGQGKPLAARIKETTDQWAFLMWQTGLCK